MWKGWQLACQSAVRAPWEFRHGAKSAARIIVVWLLQAVRPAAFWPESEAGVAF